jgi:hypothetical protein
MKLEIAVKYEHRRDAILLREIANFPNDTKSISLESKDLFLFLPG